jgi:hypothetical protein
MSQKIPSLNEKLTEFIHQQKIFFVATAAADGRINLSPKGMDTLRVLDPNRIVWLNLTGSGNETAAHVLDTNRITLMFCALEGNALILRLYGSARAIHPRDSEWNEMIAMFPAIAGSRQIFDMEIEMVQSSCGTGVPLYEYQGDRDQLVKSAEKRGPDGLRTYWEERNQRSIDDKPTGILP